MVSKKEENIEHALDKKIKFEKRKSNNFIEAIKQFTEKLTRRSSEVSQGASSNQ